jgi:hypothetical protein
MASLAHDEHFPTDRALIGAIRAQQARVRQTHQDYKAACQALADLCALARGEGPNAELRPAPREHAGA